MIGVFKSAADLRKSLASGATTPPDLALVPTMGYLHEGHQELIRRARQLCSQIVVSIFVNPLQFSPDEDYERYPRDMEHDRKVATDAGATAIFAPDVADMTPLDMQISVDPGILAQRLCGPLRPGHFRGVATIVLKLFNLVQPQVALFGWKDAQQLLIIRKLVADLNVPVQIEGVDTVREPDGLALSSRNVYLSADERAQTPELYRSLQLCATELLKGKPTVDAIRTAREWFVAKTNARFDYFEVVNMNDLRPNEIMITGQTMVAAAAWFGKTRLIDNVRI